MEPVFLAGATSLKILPLWGISLAVWVVGLGKIQELVCLEQTVEMPAGLVHMASLHQDPSKGIV